MTANIIIEGFDVGVDISRVSNVSNEVLLELLSEQIDVSIFDDLSDTTYIEMLIGNTIKGDTGKSAYQSYLDTTTDEPPLSESAWANLFGDKLDITGNGSDTKVVFAEAGATALPATGEKQSVLWGKALRYFKTQIPLWLSTKVEVDGDGSEVQASQNVDEVYTTAFPNDGEKWALYTWFGVIRAKIERLFDVKLDTTGNGSNTTVNFAEAGATALPATGENQSVLWGKALRYFKTQIPLWLSTKVEVDGDGSTVTSDSSDSADPNMEFPSQGNLWNLSAWFSLIKAKVNRLFVLAPNVFNVTATGDGTTWSFDAFDMAEFEDCTTNTLEGKTIKVHFKGYDGGGAVILDIFYDGAFRFDEYTGTLYIDCFELSRSFYIGGEMRDTPINIELVGYLFKNGNGSNTTVNFTEAGATALPITGEKQSVLWGKVLRYLKTEIPTLLNAKINAQGGNASWAESVANRAQFDASTPLPGSNTLQAIGNWFGRFSVKIEYLFGKRSLILNVTATRTLATDDWAFAAFSTSEFSEIAAIAANGAPIYVRFAGTTNGVAEPIMLYPGLWNETLSQITSRDLARGFYLNGGVAANRGAKSYDTQKYIDLGAAFNNTTGYYEYLGLTDITEAECREAYYLTGCKFASPVNFYGYGSLKTRFLFPLTNNGTTATLLNSFNSTTGIKRVRLCKNPNIADGATNLYYSTTIADMCANSSVRYIAGGINVVGITTASNLVAFTNTNMMHVFLYNLKANVSFASSAAFDEASVLCAIVNRANGTTNITMTLHPTAYAMALASTSIQAALVGSYITLASA